MCGIAGIVNLDGSPCPEADIRRLTNALAHRGPDGSGVLVDGPLGLGHRRLSILDLSDLGRQPMSAVGGRYHITYNGELYNFLELRRELEAAGLRFVTQSDTEVILAAYHHWGADCVLRFNGMWAFAIWDAERCELFLSRDRFGIKPLHYLAESRRFVFASELKAFRDLRDFTPRPNAGELKRVLVTGAASLEETFVRDVLKLRSGHNMLVTAEGRRTWRWWSTLDHLPTVPRRRSEQVAQFRELFMDSLRLRLRSDVSIATCLSGGLDSSAITCALAELTASSTERQTRDFHHAFVARYPGTPWDEGEYAQAAIDRSGVEAHMVVIDPELAIAHLRQFAFDMEMMSQALLIPLWLTYRELRRSGIVVSLDGHGADELLGGYATAYNDSLRRDGSLLRAPRRTLNRIRTIRNMYGDRTTTTDLDVASLVMRSDPFLRAGRQIVGRGADFGRRIGRRLKRGWSPSPASVPSPAWVDPWEGPIVMYDEDERAAVAELEPFNASLYMQFHGTVLPAILNKFDRCSMAHGVEIRMPFMDWRLVTYAFALPEEAKTRGGFSKRVLRDAMEGVLPEKIRVRKGKIGFVSPLPAWLNGKLGDWVADEVQRPFFLDNELWNGPVIRDWVLARNRAKRWTQSDAHRVWRYLQASLWQQTYFC